MMQSVGIFGVGEVGSAIAEIFRKKYKVLKKDVKFDEIKSRSLEVLHVCIPYSSAFEKTVVDQIKKNKPKLVIIHSTVKPETTRNIYRKIRTPIVHSPVMGTHPNLVKDMLNFKKIIGPANRKSGELATSHFKNVGIQTVTFHNSQESEFAKLLDTTYYGWNIIYAKIVWDICQKAGIDFENVYTKLNQIYNNGYKESRPNVIRPILKYQPGPIGGHCIIPNAQILDRYSKNMITSVVLDKNKSDKKP